MLGKRGGGVWQSEEIGGVSGRSEMPEGARDLGIGDEGEMAERAGGAAPDTRPGGEDHGSAQD